MKNRNAMRKTHAETGCVNEALTMFDSNDFTRSKLVEA